MHIKRTIRTCSVKPKDLFFKSTNRFRISNIIIELSPLNNSKLKKKKFRKYSCLTLNKGMCHHFWQSVLIRLWKLYQRGKRDAHFFEFEKQAQFSVPLPLL